MSFENLHAEMEEYSSDHWQLNFDLPKSFLNYSNLFLCLPGELICHTLSFLTLKELANTRLVSLPVSQVQLAIWLL